MEISFVPMLRLRAFLKRTKVDRFRRVARQLCQAIALTQEKILLGRNRANFSPKDVDVIARFESELSSQGPTPIIKLRDKLREQVVQRQKMKSMEEVTIYSEEEEEERVVTENRKKKMRKGEKEETIVDTTNEQSQEDADMDDEKDDFEDRLDVYELSDDE
jgi:nucleolar complex protein 2